MLNEGNCRLIDFFYLTYPKQYDTEFKTTLDKLDQLCRIYFDRIKDLISDDTGTIAYVNPDRLKKTGTYYIYARPLLSYYGEDLFSKEEILEFYSLLKVLYKPLEVFEPETSFPPFRTEFYERIDELERFLKGENLLMEQSQEN